MLTALVVSSLALGIAYAGSRARAENGPVLEPETTISRGALQIGLVALSTEDPRSTKYVNAKAARIVMTIDTETGKPVEGFANRLQPHQSDLLARTGSRNTSFQVRQ